jgi:DNA-binding response OmpR family regulator
MNETILMIDDDEALVRLTELNLTKAAYRFVSARHGIEGLQRVQNERPDVVLLDITMPKLDGWETCRLIREVSNVPIIVVSGIDYEADKARGLDLGADDYITKPFGMVELQARVRAAIRRADMPSRSQQGEKQSQYRVGPLLVDIPAHLVTRHGEMVSLTPIEFRLLEHLLLHGGIVLSHAQLLTAVWGFEYSDATDLLKPAISRLRQKIEEQPSDPQIIETVYGVGYRLIKPPAPENHFRGRRTAS